jgi:hypothetical protein
LTATNHKLPSLHTTSCHRMTVAERTAIRALWKHLTGLGWARGCRAPDWLEFISRDRQDEIRIDWHHGGKEAAYLNADIGVDDHFYNVDIKSVHHLAYLLHPYGLAPEHLATAYAEELAEADPDD